MILPDTETKVDLLNNEAIAKTIIELLQAQPEHPVTIGVHGDWGAGKSSILEMIEAGLYEQEGVLCIKFNGWRFQGFEDAKIALIEGIVAALIEKRPALTKATDAIKDIFDRIDVLKLAKRGGGLAFTAFTGIPSPDLILEALKKINRDNFEAAVDEAKSLIKPAGSKNIPVEIEAFRKDFDKLLDAAKVNQLIVLIDDLDRCLPDTAIETLEAIRLFVFTERTAFVVAADEAMIEYAVRKHFPDLPDSTGPRDYARNYLEKLIQVPFRIPALGETETRIYVTLLLTGVVLGEADSKYTKLINVAREQLKRPWLSSGLDSETIGSALGDSKEKVREKLALSEQLSPILASGTKGNPRQIKRFLNTLLLRQSTAKARGFGDDIQLPVLAKLMLAERFIPALYEQIAYKAAADTQGKCGELGLLEAASSVQKNIPYESDTSSDLGGDSCDEADDLFQTIPLPEWLASDEIQNWARIKPSLVGVDLRAYLFISKDRKDYFGQVSALGHLSEVVDKLFGSKFTVKGYKAELQQLAESEAKKVFDATRSRIMSTGSFTSKPEGIDGLIVLVDAKPNLQGSLLDFLEALPKDKIGAWVVSGWQGVIKESELQNRFDTLLGDWGDRKNNQILNTAAKAALNTPK